MTRFSNFINSIIAAIMITMTLLITISHAFFSNTTIFNSTINESIEAFNRYTSIYYIAVLIMVVFALLHTSNWKSWKDGKGSGSLIRPSIHWYMLIQLGLSIEYIINYTKNTLQHNLAAPLLVIVAISPTIIHIYRASTKKIQSLEDSIEEIKEKINPLY